MKHLTLFFLLLCSPVIVMGQSDVSNLAGVVVTPDSDAFGNDGTTTIEIQPGVSGLRLNFDKVLTLFGNKLVIGDASLQDAARIELATQSPAVVSLLTTTFNYTNGPPGEENYKNNTFAFGYNQDNSGNPLVAGEVTLGVHVEPKYSQAGGPFQSEVYWDWRKPDGTGYIRPWGFNVAHATGKVTQFIQGNIYFVRDNGAQWGLWYENGGLDLSYLPTAGISFANNTGGLRWKNADGSNTVAPLYVNNQNRIILGNGFPITIHGPVNLGSIKGVSTIEGAGDPGTFIQFATGYLSFYSKGVFKADFNPYLGLRLKTLLTFEADNTYDIGRYTTVNYRPRNVYVGTDVDAGGSYKVDGLKVVGNQCAAIPNSNGQEADDTRAINAILACMRSHGLVAN